MKQIALRNKAKNITGYAIVDDGDYAAMSRYTWHKNDTGYARRGVNLGSGRTRGILLHRQMLCPPRHLEVDHINGDRLDNRRANLRLVTPHQNKVNRSFKYRAGPGTHTGVSLRKSTGKWQAYICFNYIIRHLGDFSRYEDAVQARKNAEVQFFGEFARGAQCSA